MHLRHLRGVSRCHEDTPTSKKYATYEAIPSSRYSEIFQFINKIMNACDYL